MHRSKITTLTMVDVLILTAIFFGAAIYSSTMQFVALLQASQTVASAVPSDLQFADSQNLTSILTELTLMTVAFLYLKVRRFDFSQFHFGINRYTVPKTVLYILLAGAVATICEYVQMSVVDYGVQAVDNYSADEHLSQISPSLLAFALVNGFFEEWYFLGILFVHKNRIWVALLFALMVRFLFHTYQGLVGALIITTLGVSFFVLRNKSEELVPFMLAHAFFDVFGLGLPLYWLE